MEKIASRLLPGVSCRQVVLILPSEFSGVFYNHPTVRGIVFKVDECGPCVLRMSHSAAILLRYYQNSVYRVIHTNGHHGSYNPHLHIFLSEVGLNPKINQLFTMNYLPLSRL